MFTMDQYLVELFAWTLLQFAWQGVFLAISLRVCDFALRRSNSRVRYHILRIHLAALIIAPLLALLLSHKAVASPAPNGGVAGPGAFALLPSLLHSLLLPPFHLLVLALPYILVFWTAGTLIGAGLVLAGYLRSRRLHSFYPYRGGLTSVVDELARKLGIKTAPAVVEAEIGSPFVVGVRRHLLVLPRKIEQELTPEEVRAILAHELAHVKRSDYTLNLLQIGVLLLMWPHPVAWMLWNRLRHAREACCDEAAVQLCGTAGPLARALYRLAVNASPLDVAVPAAAGPLELRLQKLLTPNRSSGGILPCAALTLAMIALVLATICSARTLRANAATRIALMASPLGPTISIHAEDPAGSFFVRLHRGRVFGISIGNQSIPTAQIIQQGNSVRVLDRSGQEILALRVDPRGGIAWYPRTNQAQPNF
jgi:beta-lactamase regulating signal transducer with metallopeptidase domain